MRYLLFLILVINTSVLLRSQNFDMFDCGISISDVQSKNSRLLLLIVTDVRCGACGYMRRDIFSDSLDKKIDIRFIEFGPEDKAKEKYAMVLSRFDIRLATDCPDKLRVFFPCYYLIDRNKNKIICKINGHLPRLYKRIKRKIERKM